MKRMPLLLLLCVIAGLLLVPAHAQVEGEVLRIAIESQASFGVIDEMTRKVIAVTSDGQFSIQVHPLRGGEELPDGAPGHTLATGRLKAGDFESLAQMAAGNAFGDLPDRIDTGIMDGDFTHIKVEMDSGTLRKGGLLAGEYGPQAFRDLYEAILQAVAGGVEDPQDATPEERAAGQGIWEMGNTPGNYAGGICALWVQGKPLLTRNLPRRQTIAIEEGGGQVPADFPAEQYLDGWFYYYLYGPEAGDSNGIWRCRDGGKDKEPVVTDCRIVEWQIAGGFVYVLENIELPYESYVPVHRLWRMPVAGGGQELYAVGNAYTFALSEEYLFVATHDTSELLRIPLFGEAAESLPIRPYRFFFESGWLYYLAYENDQSAAYRCRADGTGIECLVPWAVQSLHVDEGWLYYYQPPAGKEKDRRAYENVLMRKNLDTGEEQVLDVEEKIRRDMAVVGPYLVFRVGEMNDRLRIPGDYKLWMMPKAGGTPKPLP